MKLKATVIIKSEYHGKGQSEEEITQGYIDFLASKIDLHMDSIEINIDEPIRGKRMDVVIIDEDVIFDDISSEPFKPLPGDEDEN